MMKYYNDSQITSSKVNIGKRVALNSALLGYAVAPEITPDDFSINILYSDNPYESRYVPTKSIDGRVYSLDLVNILNFKNIKITDKFDSNDQPLFYKEVIQKQVGDSLQVIKNGDVIFDGFIIDNSKPNEFVVYHNFAKTDDVYLVHRRQESGIASELKKVPLCFAPVYKEVQADTEYPPTGTFRIDAIEKRALFVPEQNIDTQTVIPNTRHGIEIEYGISGTGTIDYENNQVTLNLGVLPLYGNNYTQNDAVQFVNRFIDYTQSQYDGNIVFADPLAKNHIISLEDFKNHHNLYDVVLVVGDEGEQENAVSDALIQSKAYDDFVKAKKTMIFDCCGTIQSFKLLEAKQLQMSEDELKKELEKSPPLKKYVGEISYSDQEEFSIDNMYLQNLVWQAQPEDAVKQRTLTIANSAYDETDYKTEVSLEWSSQGWSDGDKATIQGESILLKRYHGFTSNDEPSEWSAFIDQHENLIISELGFCKITNNLNLKNQFDLLIKIIQSLNSKIKVKINGLKDIIYSRNSLFSNEAAIIGYDRIVIGGKDYLKKVVSTDVKSLLATHTQYPLSEVSDIEITIPDELKGRVECVSENNEIGFYVIDQLSQSLYDSSRYCMIKNITDTYKLEFSLISRGKTTRLSKNIKASYIPRKQYVSITSFVSPEAINTLLSQDANARLRISKNPSLNLMIYDSEHNRYLSDAQDLEIRLSNITAFTNIEISAIHYNLFITDNAIAVESTNGFDDCIRMPRGLKSYQNWSPIIKNMEFWRNFGTTKYCYKTLEFYNQVFDQDYLKVVYKEECESAGWHTLQLQHCNISKDQTRKVEKEKLLQVTDYVFMCKHYISDPSAVEIFQNSNKTDQQFVIEGNIIKFAKPQTTSGTTFEISYSYNYLKVYGLATQPQYIKYARTSRFNNIEYVLQLTDYRNHAFVGKENIKLYTQDEGRYQEVDANKYFVDDVNQVVVITTGKDTDMRKQYYVSGYISNKIEYGIDFINYEQGLIFTKNKVDFRDTIFADYLYESKEFELYRDGENVLDLNPLRGHVSIYDGQQFKGKELINKKCFVVLFPCQSVSNGIITQHNGPTTRFTFSEKEADLWEQMYKAIKLGSLALINNFDLSDIAIMDARTLGGGLKEIYSTKDLPIAEFWNDVENVSSHAYRPGGLLIVRLPKQLLIEYGGVFEREYVETVVSNYQPLGCHYKVEFYDLFDTDLIPRKDLELPHILKQDLIDKYFTYKARD